MRPVLEPQSAHRGDDVNREIVLVKLGKNQELKFTAKAKKVSAQHSPRTQCRFTAVVSGKRILTVNVCACSFVCRQGIGKEHSKWSPVAVATFQYEPDVRLNDREMDKLDEVRTRGECCWLLAVRGHPLQVRFTRPLTHSPRFVCLCVCVCMSLGQEEVVR